MERDGVLAHGASAFLQESLMVRGDEYYLRTADLLYDTLLGSTMCYYTLIYDTLP